MTVHLNPVPFIRFLSLTAFAWCFHHTALAVENPPNPTPKPEYLAARKFCKEDAKNKCVTPYGTVLGELRGVVAYSNCNSSCISLEESILPKEKFGGAADEWIGYKYQCDEYAARWWATHFGVSFGLTNAAAGLWEHQDARRIRDGRQVRLQLDDNGGKAAPQVGDLLIYKATSGDPDWEYGHVAVVANVDAKNGFVDLAEQNYENKKWPGSKSYARRLVLQVKKDQFTMYDIAYPAKNPKKDLTEKKGKKLILGWIRPVLPEGSLPQ